MAKGEKVVAVESIVRVARTVGRVPLGNPEGETETLMVHRFVTDPARIGVRLHLTLNLGNFESAKMDVSLDLPCYKEEIEEGYAFVEKWVEQRIEAERKQIRGNKDGSTNPL